MKKVNLLSLVLISISIVSFAQAQENKFAPWLNNRIKSATEAKVAAKVNQRSSTNQAEAPSMSGNTSSLLDQSSASDLFGVALNLAGLSSPSKTDSTDGMSDNKEVNSVAVTATAYSFYAALKRVDPLEPTFYNGHSDWRKLSFTLGYDSEKINDTATQERVTLFGFKYLIKNDRDATKARHNKSLETLTESLKTASIAFGNIANDVKMRIFKNPKIRERYKLDEKIRNEPRGENKVFVDFIIEHIDKEEEFKNVLDTLGDEGLADIDKFIADHLDTFVSLDKTASDAIDEIRNAPQFSFAFQGKTRKEGADEYKAELIYDKGLYKSLNFTFNGAFEYKDNKAIGADVRGASIAGQLEMKVTPDKCLDCRNPIFASLAYEGKWMNNIDWTHKVQGKVKIPIANGIDFPISITYANRTELIKEKEVRGQFGFTFDLARLVNANLFK